VGGGSLNQATAAYAAVLGGSSNQAIGVKSAVAAGASNTAQGEHSSILGGKNNAANGVSRQANNLSCIHPLTVFEIGLGLLF
jgi:hypothetical protein